MINLIINLLRSDGYVTLNKTLVRNIGLLPATIFSEMCSKYKYFHDKGRLKDGFFYCTIPDIEKELGLSRKEQDTAINKLISLKLIEKKVMKLKGDEAPKRYIKITNDINSLMPHLGDVENSGFVQKGQIESEELDNSICPKGTPNNNNIIINNTKENNQSVSPAFEEAEKNVVFKIDEEVEEKEVQSIIVNAQVELYQQDIQLIIKESIKDIYTNGQMPYILKMGLNHQELKNKIKLLQYMHIDRAIQKLKEAQQLKGVKNIKIYFCKCLLSAISEVGIDNLYFE